MVYIGIDIGKNGAIVIQENGEIITHAMPTIAKAIDLREIYNILKPYENKNCKVAFEDLHAIYQTSAASMFSFGFAAGAIEAIVYCLNLSFVKVSAKIWQKHAFVGIKEIRKPSRIDKLGRKVKGSLETKKMALLAAKRLYPEVNLKATVRSKKEHDGIIDALLISDWLKNNYK